MYKKRNIYSSAYKRNKNQSKNIDIIFFQCITCAILILIVFAIKKISGPEGNLTQKLKNAITESVAEENIEDIKDVFDFKANSQKEIVIPQIETISVSDNKNKWITPCMGRITSLYGLRKDPFGENKQFHKGIDFAVNENTELIAVSSGVIKKCGYSKSYGYNVTYTTYDGYDVFYAHLNKICVKENQHVEKGDIIALSGNTGMSTGAHLHFEISKEGKNINPIDLIGVEKI